MDADKRQKLEMMATTWGFDDRLPPYFDLVDNLERFREQLLALRGSKLVQVYGLESVNGSLLPLLQAHEDFMMVCGWLHDVRSIDVYRYVYLSELSGEVDGLLEALISRDDVAIASHLRRVIEVAAVFSSQIPELRIVVDKILELDEDELLAAPKIADVWSRERVDWEVFYTSAEASFETSNTTRGIFAYLKPFGKAVPGIEGIYDACSSYIHPSNRVMLRYRDPAKAFSRYGKLGAAVNVYTDRKITREVFALSFVLGAIHGGGLANRLNPLLPTMIDQITLAITQLSSLRKLLLKIHRPIARRLFRQQRFRDDPGLANLPCPCGSGKDFCRCCG